MPLGVIQVAKCINCPLFFIVKYFTAWPTTVYPQFINWHLHFSGFWQLWTCVPFLSGKYLGWDNSFTWWLCKELPTLLCNCSFSSAVHEHSSCSISLPVAYCHNLFTCFFTFGILIAKKWYLITLICIFLVNDAYRLSFRWPNLIL